MDAPPAQHHLQSFERRPCTKQRDKTPPWCLPASGIPQQCVPSQQAPTLALGWRGLGRGLDRDAWPFCRGAGGGCCHCLSSPNTTPGGMEGWCWQPAARSCALGGRHVQLGVGQRTPQPLPQPLPARVPAQTGSTAPCFTPFLCLGAHRHTLESLKWESV